MTAPDFDLCAACGNQFPAGQLCDTCRSSPIYASLAAEFDNVVRRLAQRAHSRHSITHAYDARRPQDGAAAGPTGDTMSVLADVEQWIADAATHAPAIHDAAVRLENLNQSKIVQTLEAIGGVVDPGVEAIVVQILGAAGAAAAKLAELTAPADVPVGIDGTPGAGLQQQQQTSGIAQ